MLLGRSRRRVRRLADGRIDLRGLVHFRFVIRDVVRQDVDLRRRCCRATRYSSGQLECGSGNADRGTSVSVQRATLVTRKPPQEVGMTTIIDSIVRHLPLGKGDFDVEADARAAYARRMGHDRPLAERAARGKAATTGLPARRRTSRPAG